MVEEDGAKRYPGAKELLITADGGSSNGSRCRLWKMALQDLANQVGMPIHVRHFRTSHVLPHHPKLARTAVGKPRHHHQTDCEYDAHTGLKIRAELDRGTYFTGIKVSDEDLAALALKTAKFHGDWNYANLLT